MSTFMKLMKEVVRPFVDMNVIVYFGNILASSKTKQNHMDHLRQVFLVLMEQKLYVKLEKCESFTQRVHSLDMLFIMMAYR